MTSCIWRTDLKNCHAALAVNEPHKKNISIRQVWKSYPVILAIDYKSIIVGSVPTNRYFSS